MTTAATVPLPGIEHIIVLMLENRSFDNILGNLYPYSPGYNGLPPGASNTYEHQDGFRREQVTVYPTSVPPSGKSIYITPNPDPGESAKDIAEQIDGGSMGGFAQNYRDVHLVSATPGDIMCYFNLSSDGNRVPQLAVTWRLGSQFGVSDQWFASGPVQTFPNRMFSVCGLPGQFGDAAHPRAPVNDIDYVGQGVRGSYAGGALGSVTNRTIFEALDAGPNGIRWNPARWKVYFHDVPLTALSKYVYDAWAADSECVSNFDATDYNPPHGKTFFEDLMSGTLPAFSIIEPRYWGNYSRSNTIANSNHPGNDHYQTAGLTGNPIDVTNGEALLWSVFEPLARNQKLFNKTLLIVTYDEHGGCYDHVAPPAAVNPFPPSVANSSTYSRYGVRVPALFVNPRIRPGTIVRPPAGSRPFDHTSIIATVAAQFAFVRTPLTPRVASAPLLDNLIPPNPVNTEAAELPLGDALRAWIEAVPRPAVQPAPRKSLDEHQKMVSDWVRAKGQARSNESPL